MPLQLQLLAFHHEQKVRNKVGSDLELTKLKGNKNTFYQKKYLFFKLSDSNQPFILKLYFYALISSLFY